MKKYEKMSDKKHLIAGGSENMGKLENIKSIQFKKKKKNQNF
jgi:hypothetical protein